MSIGSSVRSSASLASRRTTDTTSESDISIQNEKHFQKSGHFREKSSLVLKDERHRQEGRQRKPRIPTGRVRPYEGMNKNNNSNKNGDLDLSYIKDKLQDILEDENYWAGSSNQSSEIHSVASSRNNSTYSAQSRKTISESSDSSVSNNSRWGRNNKEAIQLKTFFHKCYLTFEG